MDLKAFMQPLTKEVSFVVSDRFKGKNGQSLAWRVKVLDQSEIEQMRRQCMKKVTDLKTRISTEQTDSDKFMDMLVERCVVEPNLNAVELQDFYHAIGAVETAKKMLLPGEYATLTDGILAAQGYESEMSEQIRTAKN